jgi:hypothetical protein
MKDSGDIRAARRATPPRLRAAALSEGHTSTITTNVSEVLGCCRRLAAHPGASVEIVERDDGLTDVIVRRKGGGMDKVSNTDLPETS